MIQLSENAQKLLGDLIAKQDTDKRVSRTFTESDMVELALTLLTNMNKIALDNQGENIFGLSVAQFELAAHQR